ncbi:MAG: shikimate dehydrogenase [Elainellaceae cyanobacterium]
MITGTTQLLGVIGYPVQHSLSPVMHNAAIAHIGANYVYLPFQVHPDDLERAIAGFAAIGLMGFNITIPHKQSIMPFLSEMSSTAQAIGAVNTVWRTPQGWAGTNTDVEGFLAPLSHRTNWSQAIAIVLGNGGAARAVVAGCASLGCAEICVVGRNRDKLNAFRASWADSPAINLSVYPWDALPTLLSNCTLLVNTTPLGMHPRIDESPVSPSDLERLPPEAIAYDLIYTPNPTLFLQRAKMRNLMAIDGLEMLVQQGAAALRIWLEQPVPVDIMRQSLKEQLR